MRILFFLISQILIFQVCLAQISENLDKQTSNVDLNIDTLKYYLGSYPPNIKTDTEKKFVNHKFSQVEKLLIDLNNIYPNNPKVLVRLGDLYQLGHNFDLEDSWIKAEHYLKEAIKLDSSFYYAHWALGHLYVTTDIKYAKDAEKELLIVLNSSKEDLKIRTYIDLTFSMYYQARFSEAKEYLEKYIAVTHDGSVDKLLKIINEKLEKSK